MCNVVIRAIGLIKSHIFAACVIVVLKITKATLEFAVSVAYNRLRSIRLRVRALKYHGLKSIASKTTTAIPSIGESLSVG